MVQIGPRICLWEVSLGRFGQIRPWLDRHRQVAGVGPTVESRRSHLINLSIVSAARNGHLSALSRDENSRDALWGETLFVADRRCENTAVQEKPTFLKRSHRLAAASTRHFSAQASHNDETPVVDDRAKR